MFLFGKKNFPPSFFKIYRDTFFSTSLITIDFYFPDLIYIEFPKIGRKLYNGTIQIASDRIDYPYKIKVVTGGGDCVYEIPFEKSTNEFHSLKIPTLKPFPKRIKSESSFKVHGHKLNLPTVSYSKHQVLLKKRIIVPKKIKHTTFNTENYL